MSDSKELLDAGIQAVMAGQLEEAHQLLLQALEVDDQNELAWIWLSRVMDDEADKRICYENALTINPTNKIARKGLVDLGGTPPPLPAEQPVPTATSAEYQQTTTPEFEVVTESIYDDVWTRNVEICGYCAYEIDFDHNRCPRCKRSLTTTDFLNEKTSHSFFFFFIFLACTAGLILGQSGLLYVFRMAPLGRTVDILLAVILILITGAYVTRRQWAYWAALFHLIVIILVNQIVFQFDPFERDMFFILTTILNSILAGIALLYGYFKAGGNFDTASERLIGHVRTGAWTADQYAIYAKQMAKKGLWASAILNWQRAVGKEPNRPDYLHHLGKAYAKLGFYERSLDMLTSAQKYAGNKQVQREISNLITQVKQKVKNG